MKRPPACYMGKDTTSAHPAEKTPDGGYYVFAGHRGNIQRSCAAHSGFCHTRCYPANLYPQLYQHIKVDA